MKELNYYMATYEQYLKEAREMELSGGPHVDGGRTRRSSGRT